MTAFATCEENCVDGCQYLVSCLPAIAAAIAGMLSWAERETPRCSPYERCVLPEHPI